MRLLPSQIRYSQDSISNIFSDSGYLIGEVLDDLCYGRMQKRDFPRIEVARIGRKWYTADNRRLWIFRKLEELGRCRRIPVDEADGIPNFKMTTRNGGTDIVVRGYPGGFEIENLGYYPSSCSCYDCGDGNFYEQFRNFRI